MNRHLLVLGGGLSGLASAFHLSRRFPESLITLVEKQSRLGGWISSHRVHINLLGLQESVITTPTTSAAAKNRYLQVHETQGLITLPNSLLSFFSPPMRSWMLPVILKESTKRWNRPFGITDESVDSFMSRRFGPFFARMFGSALVHGIYAADSRQLSVRAAFPSLWAMEDRGWGSVVRGALIPSAALSRGDYNVGDLPEIMKGVSVYSFSDGMETLHASALTILCDTSVSSLGVTTLNNDLEVRMTNGQVIHPSRVVSALPLPVLSDVLSPELNLPHLTANPTSSVTVLNLVFPPTQPRLHPAGFGYLIPRPPTGYSEDNPGILGTVFDSCALSAQDQNPAQFTKMTVMLGGPNPITPSHTDIDAVLKQLSVVPRPVYVQMQHHVDCIPTPTPGHLERMEEMKTKLAKGIWAGRLDVIGAGVGGVSVGDCVESAKRVGEGWTL
ncbi:Protoporphyrinogen oxidase [Gymnopus androsaceus JB14]|uniref:Protoporphyrinogen oxidase n=1 Tax=Gymnopus androsaceus JB14 TaxID=1447944 RepID=A0A6A4HFY4_9AGAR|nr:Protoporphyrinogen oxidase [Gymnopus androsaceus JB14]